MHRYAALWVLAALAPAAQAPAAVVEGDYGGVVFTAAPGEVNDVRLWREHPDTVVQDRTATLVPGQDCRPVTMHEVRCRFGGRCGGYDCLSERDVVDLGDRDDSIRVFGKNHGVYVTAGDGDDAVRVDGYSLTASGGTGDDVLRGGSATDHLVGGPGSDVLDGRGGEFSDSVSYASHAEPVTVTLDGRRNDGARGERDHVLHIESVVGGSGDDRLVGDADRSRGGETSRMHSLYGAGGDDVVLGGGGRDSVEGGDGYDLLDGRAGDDYVSGGPGDDALRGGLGDDAAECGEDEDRALVDAILVPTDCEWEREEPWHRDRVDLVLPAAIRTRTVRFQLRVRTFFESPSAVVRLSARGGKRDWTVRASSRELPQNERAVRSVRLPPAAWRALRETGRLRYRASVSVRTRRDSSRLARRFAGALRQG